MDFMKHSLLIFSFITLNIILSSNIIWVIGYLLILFLFISPSQPVSNILLIAFFIFIEILAIGKLFLFPFLYLSITKKKNLEKFFNKKYIISILSLALLIDFIFIYMWHKFNFYILVFYILSFGGVFICYLSLIIWYKINKKTSKNAEYRQHH